MIPLGKPIEQILGGGALLLLVFGCVLVLQPFLSAILWAAVICFSTWPVYRRCERAVGGNKSLTAAMMTLLVALVLVAPFAVMVPLLTDSVGNLLTAGNQILEQGPAAATAPGRRTPVNRREPGCLLAAPPLPGPPGSATLRADQRHQHRPD
jgi:predicted PurR-regulated permease PerM